MMELCRDPWQSRDAPALRIGLECNADAPAAARAAIRGFFAERNESEGTLSTLALLVSELVSNAVSHSDAPPSSDILLCVRISSSDEVRVEVTDQGSGFTPAPRDPDRHGGYGLYLVAKQATQWGVDQRDGARVWFEMPVHGG